MTWGGILLATAVGFLPSVGSSPPLWQDEVQIVDYGRVLLEPDTKWAMTWMTHGNRPITASAYLGCGGAELAYRATGSALGTRWFCILGGFVLATVLLALLLDWSGNDQTLRMSAVLLSGIVLVLPVLVGNYRSGRVDAWAMAFVLGGAWALHRYLVTERHRWLALCIVLLALAPCVWIRAFAAIPAAVLPLLFQRMGTTRRVWPLAFGIGLGVTLLVVILQLPALAAWQDLQALKQSPVKEFSVLNTGAAGGSGGLLLSWLREFVAVYQLSMPFVLIACWGGWVVLRQLASRTHCALFIAIVLATGVAQLRSHTGQSAPGAAYWMPLFALLAWQGLVNLGRNESGRRLVMASLVVLLAGYWALNVVGRSYRGWIHREARGHRALMATVDAVPPHPRRLIVEDFRLYFLLRERGFEPFYLFADVDVAKRELPLKDMAKVGVIVGGNSPRWSEYATQFIPHAQMKELPGGYRWHGPNAEQARE